MRFVPGACPLILCTAIATAQETLQQKALAFEQQGQWQPAEAAWREVTRQAPSSGSAHAHLGVALSHEGDYARAAAAYQKALALKANLPGIQLNLGLALFTQEKLDEAIRPLKAA